MVRPTAPAVSRMTSFTRVVVETEAVRKASPTAPVTAER